MASYSQSQHRQLQQPGAIEHPLQVSAVAGGGFDGGDEIDAKFSKQNSALKARCELSRKQPSSSSVVLVKTPSPSYERDGYTQALRDAGYVPVYLPILQTSFNDLSGLAELVAQGVRGRWEGVVLTSARAVDALQAAITLCDEHPDPDWPPPDWDSVPFFVVGPSTGKALRSLSGSPRSFPPPDRLRILGEHDSGSGSSLGRFIARQFDRHVSEPGEPARSTDGMGDDAISPEPVRLLLFTGDKQHPGLRTTLGACRPPFVLTEVQVYATHACPEATLEPPLSGTLAWVVFFSPNTAELALPVLARQLSFELASPLTKVAAIGPTTYDWLAQAGRQAEAVARKPDAISLLQAIVAADDAPPKQAL